MIERDPSLTDPEAIKSSVQTVVAEEEARRPVEANPADVVDDPTELAPGITVTDVELAFRSGEVGDSALAIKLMHGKFVYDHVLEKPFRFNCTHWFRDKNCSWRKALFDVADLYAQRAQYYWDIANRTGEKDDLKKAEAWSKRVNSCRKVSKILDIWKGSTSGDGSLGISGDEWNKNPTLLPCVNVVIDLETGKPIPPDPKQYFNMAATVPFKGLHEEAPLWMDTIQKALCYNPELIDYFEYMVGFAATGIQTKDFFCIYGPKGNNAKSVLFEWILKILGDFAVTIKVEMLLEESFMRSADGPSPALLKIRGRRMACTSEASDKHRFNVAKIKGLCSGGDRMEARGINASDIVEFIPECTLILHSNALPKAGGNDEAFYRRLKVIGFHAIFIKPNEGPEDPAKHVFHEIPRTEVDKRLTAESPGILAWIVRCAMKALRRGDMPQAPKCVLFETNQYRNEQDLVGHFMRECTEPDANNKEQMKDIYLAFRHWCKTEQMIPEKAIMSQNNLGKDLKQRPGLERIESNKTYYKGLRIKTECRSPEQEDNGKDGGRGFL